LQIGILELGKQKRQQRLQQQQKNCVIENINENLHNTNLVADSVPGFLPNTKQLKQ